MSDGQYDIYKAECEERDRRRAAAAAAARTPLVVLEGVDGAGTTSVAAALLDALAAAGVPAVRTREPTDRPIGALIRGALRGAVQIVPPGVLRPSEAWDPGPEAVAALFAADRLDHARNVVAPARARGELVVTDRYYHSSLTYQVATCGEARLAWVRQLNAHAPPPDLVVLVRVSAATAAARRTARGGDADAYERDAGLQARLVAAYDELAALAPRDRVAVVDGEAALPTVVAATLAHVLELPWVAARVGGGAAAP